MTTEETSEIARFSVCIFCGAKPGLDGSRHVSDAYQAGQLIAQKGWRLVYGGGGLGLMGSAADGALNVGGNVLGVIPERLVEAELAHPGVTELRIVPDMAVRKTRLIEQSDAFLILPGGMGTLDELFEVITLTQLGYMQKPIIIYNPDGFYDLLMQFGDHLVASGFVNTRHWANVQAFTDLGQAVNAAGLEVKIVPSILHK